MVWVSPVQTDNRTTNPTDPIAVSAPRTPAGTRIVRSFRVRFTDISGRCPRRWGDVAASASSRHVSPRWSASPAAATAYHQRHRSGSPRPCNSHPVARALSGMQKTRRQRTSAKLGCSLRCATE